MLYYLLYSSKKLGRGTNQLGRSFRTFSAKFLRQLMSRASRSAPCPDLGKYRILRKLECYLSFPLYRLHYNGNVLFHVQTV